MERRVFKMPQDEDLAKAIKELRTEIREMKELMGMIISMMMEMEGPEDVDDRFNEDMNSDFLMYN